VVSLPFKDGDNCSGISGVSGDSSKFIRTVKVVRSNKAVEKYFYGFGYTGL
jgi:hypothetical protein